MVTSTEAQPKIWSWSGCPLIKVIYTYFFNGEYWQNLLHLLESKIFHDSMAGNSACSIIGGYSILAIWKGFYLDRNSFLWIVLNDKFHFSKLLDWNLIFITRTWVVNSIFSAVILHSIYCPVISDKGKNSIFPSRDIHKGKIREEAQSQNKWGWW